MMKRITPIHEESDDENDGNMQSLIEMMEEMEVE